MPLPHISLTREQGGDQAEMKFQNAPYTQKGGGSTFPSQGTLEVTAFTHILAQGFASGHRGCLSGLAAPVNTVASKDTLTSSSPGTAVKLTSSRFSGPWHPLSTTFLIQWGWLGTWRSEVE